MTFGNNDEYQLQMRTDLKAPKPLIEFKTCFPVNTWMGVGLGAPNMHDAELVFFMAPVNESLRKVVNSKMTSAKSGRPDFIPTESALYKAAIGTCGDGKIEITTSRPLNAEAEPGGNNTYVIPIGEDFDFLAAGLFTKYVFNSTYDKMPGHAGGKGFSKIMKLQISKSGKISIAGSFDLYLLHGIAMWAAWGILGLLQLSSTRYLKMYWKSSIWIHRISAMLIWTTTFVMALWVFAQDEWELKQGLHPAMGLAILVCVTFPLLGGIAARYTSENARWNTVKLLQLKMGHKLFGYLLLIVAQVTLLLGSLAYSEGNGGEMSKTLGIVGMVIIIVLVTLFEISSQIYKKKEQVFNGH